MPGFSQTFGNLESSGWVEMGSCTGSTEQRLTDEPHRGYSIHAGIGVDLAAQNYVAIPGT